MTTPLRPFRLTCQSRELPDYAGGRLSAERTAAWDLHLVACHDCGAAVAEERRLQAVLSGAPSLPGSLRGQLLALGAADSAGAPDVPDAPADLARLTTLAPTAPPVHRSVLRSAVCAAAAAGASAAAAWSLGMAGATPITTVRSTVLLQAPASVPRGLSAGAATAQLVSLGGRSATTVERGAAIRAQSTP